MTKKPMELLTAELEELERARKKSEEAFKEQKITEGEHEEHMENLTPMIEEYRYVIRVINLYR
jgi:hypothetical protein